MNREPQRNEGMSVDDALFCMTLIANEFNWTPESVERIRELTEVLMTNPVIFWETYFRVPTLEEQQWQN